ncbi:MAG: NADH-quinone oxidoreductase subunit NuoH [Pseudomonadota bacterium]
MNQTLYVVLLLAKIGLVFGVFMMALAYTVLLERKVLGFIQLRHGPNRTGPWGLLQPLADGLKLFLKQDIVVSGADRFIYVLAPMLAFVAAMLPFAVVPVAPSVGPGVVSLFGHRLDLAGAGLTQGVVSDLNVGVLYVMAVGSLSVYAVVLGGWSSNSKYSLLGGLRSAAQMISYELSVGIAVVGVVMLTGSLSLTDIVEAQARAPFVLIQPLGFVVFLVASFAECCRTPFDLTECDNELVAGYQTEYSSMKFALFQLAEYAHVLTVSALAVTLYLGGWQGPFLPPPVWFALKTGVLVFFFIWVRGTLPRFRFDQLMGLGWKGLLPLSLLNVLVTAVAVTTAPGRLS